MDITCMCMTHGRAYLLAEAVESFRRQRIPYALEVEMLIVNDCPEQTLECDVPGVRIINLDRPITDMSNKQNYTASEARGTWLAYWDDDDVWMPFRLEWSKRFVMEHPEYLAFRHTRAWYWDFGRIERRPYNLFFGSAFVNRAYYLRCGGAVPGQPADNSAWRNMEAGGKTCAVKQTAEETFFIYRWGGTGVHDSGIPGEITSEERHRIFRQKTLADPRFVPGVVKVVPGYQQDYEAMVREAIAAGKGNVA